MVGGGEGIKERADFLAQAIRFGFTLHDLSTMENVYSPAIGALNEPIVVAATNGARGAAEGGAEPRSGPRFFRLAAGELRALPARRRPREAREDATGTPPAPRTAGAVKEIFWRRVFAPTYRALPWPVRTAIMRAMPGSHRQTWAPPPERRGPAV